MHILIERSDGMIVDRIPTTESIGRIFAEAVRGDESIRELWVAQDSEGFVISVFTDEIDADHERRIYARSMDVHQQFPDALFEIHVNNPRYFPARSPDEIRADLLTPNARKIPLRH